MANSPALQKLDDLMKSLYEENVLDEDQFYELERLEHDSGYQGFILDTMNLYEEDANKLLNSVGQELLKSAPDFVNLESYLYQFKGASGSVAAKRVTTVADQVLAAVKDRNISECRAAFLRMKNEHADFQSKMRKYFELVREYLSEESSSSDDSDQTEEESDE